MADRAIVVGCDAYPCLSGGDLRGAVADALAVREWLLSRQGGAMAADQLTLLASPSDAGAQPDAGTAAGPATLGAFNRAVREVVSDKTAREADRLFVYLAGHGLRTDPVKPALAQDAFAFTDYSTDTPASDCAGIVGLLTALRQSLFGVVVVIVDACRNYPFRKSFTLGSADFDPVSPAGRSYEPRVFLLQSTLPGRTAAGGPAGDTGVVRGEFTVALLAGLAGAGTAKSYDERADRPYVVRWSTLTSFVETAVPSQAPRGRAEGDVVLATFPDGFFDQVKLTVQVDRDEPGETDGLSVRVRYADPSALHDPELVLGGPAPVEFAVPPRRQHVTAQDGASWGRIASDVYEDASVVVPIRPGGPQRIPVTGREVYRGGGRLAEGLADIRADDPAAVLRVRDGSGRTLLSGLGAATGWLRPGSYTAVVTGAEGRQRRAALDIEAFAQTRLELAAPGSVSQSAEPELRWASDAAVLGWNMAVDSLSFGYWIAAAGIDPPPNGEVLLTSRVGTVVEVPGFVSRGPLGWRLVLPDHSWLHQPGWVTVQVGEHALTVPRLRAEGTVIDLGGQRLTVRLFDRGVVGQPRGLALLDRAQALLAAGDSEAVAIMIRESPDVPWDRPGSVADTVRRAAAGQSWRHGLASAVPPADAPGLLHTGLWAVFIDRRPHRSRPLGSPADAETPDPPG
jgi:hypothetical protein